MKIAIYTYTLTSGGAERRASIYANYFNEQGIETILITAHKTDKEYLLNPSIKRFYVKETKKEYLDASRKEKIHSLEKILSDEKPSLVISFLPTMGCYAVLATKNLKGVKTIYSVTLYQKKYKLFAKLKDHYACAHSDFITLQCEEQLLNNKRFVNKCLVSYNPIDNKWPNYPKRNFDKISAISVGRLVNQKNHDSTVKAVKKAHDLGVDISLDIFGDGPLKEKIQKQINKLGANDYIKIYPFTKDIVEEYNKHNVFISSSKYEGFPNAIAEAMMSGLVCLSSKCPTGPKEIINSEENGFLFNSQNELVNQLVLLSKDKELCERISFNAFNQTKNRFDKNVILSKLFKDISSKLDDEKK